MTVAVPMTLREAAIELERVSAMIRSRITSDSKVLGTRGLAADIDAARETLARIEARAFPEERRR